MFLLSPVYYYYIRIFYVIMMQLCVFPCRTIIQSRGKHRRIMKQLWAGRDQAGGFEHVSVFWLLLNRGCSYSGISHSFKRTSVTNSRTVLGPSSSSSSTSDSALLEPLALHFSETEEDRPSETSAISSRRGDCFGASVSFSGLFSPSTFCLVCEGLLSSPLSPKASITSALPMDFAI